MGWGTSINYFTVSKHASETILFCLSGQTTIKQRVTETVSEARGLTAAAATAAAGVTNSTVQTPYYATIGGVDHSITVTTGTLTEIRAWRANEADGWRLTKREVTYASNPAPDAYGKIATIWRTSPVQTGFVTYSLRSITKEINLHFNYSGSRLFTVKTIKTYEAKNVDYNSISDEIASHTYTNVEYTRLVCRRAVALYRMIPLGTESHAEYRNVSNFPVAHGDVTYTEITYQFANGGGTDDPSWEVYTPS